VRLTSRRVRVVLLTQYFPPEVGAPQTRIAALARGLAKRGVEVVVHTCPPHYPDGEIKAPYRNRLLGRERVDGVRVVRSAVYAAPNRGFARRLGGHLSFASSALATLPASGPADVVVVETPPLFLAGAAIAYAKAKRARLVLNVADLWPDSAIELGALNSPAAIKAARVVERAAYRSAAAIACPTEGIFETLESRPESQGKTALMRPAVDLDRFKVSMNRPSEERPADAPLHVLYAGTVGMAHGLGTLLDAAELLAARPDAPVVEVTIAGDGADGPALRERLARGGLKGVRMLGAVPAEQIPELYAEADVAVVMLRDVPLFHGALPTKMLEAMAAGRPVVLAARGEAARVLDGAGAGVVVDPEDPAALADAFAALASDPQRRIELGAAGRTAVEKEFGRGPWLDRWQDLLERAASAARR
jgi:glycosyltransferase involved in cell wall biosynthesis